MQLRFDGRQLVAQQAFAFGANPTEVVIQPEGVEPADVPVVEQLLDLGEIRFARSAKARCSSSAGLVPAARRLLALDDPGLDLEKFGETAGDVALQRVVGSQGPVLLIGRRLLEAAFLRFGELTIAELHLVEHLPEDPKMGIGDLLVELADIGEACLPGQLRLGNLEPDGLRSSPPARR